MMPRVMHIKDELAKKGKRPVLTDLTNNHVQSGREFGKMIGEEIIIALEKNEDSLVLDFNDVSGFVIPLMEAAFGNLEEYLDETREGLENAETRFKIEQLLLVPNWMDNFLRVDAETKGSAEELKKQILSWAIA